MINFGKKCVFLLIIYRVDLHLLMSLQPYAFFDESGKWRDRDFICLCGYLSDEDKWNRFLQHWKSLCDNYGIKSVHMSTFHHEAKEKGWDDGKTEQVLLEFARVIRNHVIVDFAVGLDAKYYRSLPKAQKDRMGNPSVACLHRLLRLIRNRLHAERYPNRIAVTFDEEEGTVIGFYKAILGLREANPDLGNYIGSVSFADDQFIIPLQAADMLAYLTGKWFHDRMSGKARTDELPEVLKSLLVSPDSCYGMDYEQELWDAERLGQELNNFLRKE